MWRSWGNSSPKTSSSSSSHHPDKDKHHQFFRCSSFKDIENLCLDPNDSDIPPNSTSTPTSTASPSAANDDSNKPTDPLKRQPSIPRRSVFHRVRTANALLRQWPGRSDAPKPEKLEKPDTRIVVYYTSLRVIRPTFEACRAVQSILQGFRVAVDERDVAMDSGFMTELRDLLGLKITENLGLPRVFVGGRYIGGAEEVKQLHEIGELKKLIAGLPLVKPGTCATCGGYRFVLCAECSGSRRIFSDKTGFRTCTTCNENGLIRCPRCASPPPRPVLAPVIAP